MSMWVNVTCFPKWKTSKNFSTWAQKISSPMRSHTLYRKQGAPGRGGFSLPRPPSLSASHTAYPATFGTSFSLLGFSHLGHWHKINEDTKKTQGSELEGVGGWGVKLLGCKIALAAVLLFQHFMASCSASVPTCLLSLPSSFFHLFFCPRRTSAWVWHASWTGWNFLKYSNDHPCCLVCTAMWFVLPWPPLQRNKSGSVSLSWWERAKGSLG